ncbi:2538_t:CDS:2, partial [Paraglomus brasilianum]
MSFINFFLPDVERQFNQEVAHLASSKEELFEYNNTLRADGRPKRPCGAAQIFAVDFFKCGQHGSGMELVMGAWKSLDDSTKRRYEAAAAMVKKDFLDKHSYYVNKRAGITPTATPTAFVVTRLVLKQTTVLNQF